MTQLSLAFPGDASVLLSIRPLESAYFDRWRKDGLIDQSKMLAE